MSNRLFKSDQFKWNNSGAEINVKFHLVLLILLLYTSFAPAQTALFKDLSLIHI